MVTLCIPARLASTRLPRKVLLDLGGKPVVQHVWERAKKVKQAERVVIVTDAEEVAEVARKFADHISQVEEYRQFAASMSTLKFRGLEPVTTYLVNNQISRSNIREVIERAVVGAWIDSVIE